VLGERELAPEPYERESDADWLTGAFMFLRREALEAAGLLDERFFMSSEETDLCFRVKEAGYRVVHLPSMTILHHAGKRGTNPRMDAQYAYARRLFAEKHFAAGTRTAYLAALGLRYGLRAVTPDRPSEVNGDGALRRQSAKLSLQTLAGLRPPPFGAPPAVAVAPRDRRAA
jgi:GT2 family glycosyltransferase